MAVATSSLPAAAFELKTAALTLLAVALKTADPAAWEAALRERFAEAPALFDNDPVAIDLGAIATAPEPIDFVRLIALLRSHRMLPIAVRGGSAAQTEAALAAGLVEADATAASHDAPPAAARSTGRVEAAPAGQAAFATSDAAAIEAPALDAPARAASSGTRPTQIVDKPLRSGQLVYAKGADLVVLAVVSFGAEVIADGNIHVYAPLRGRALAGARGDTGARIFTTCLEPQLVSIAGLYRTSETDLPDDVRGRPAQVRLDGEKLVVEALQLD